MTTDERRAALLAELAALDAQAAQQASQQAAMNQAVAVATVTGCRERFIESLGDAPQQIQAAQAAVEALAGRWGELVQELQAIAEKTAGLGASNYIGTFNEKFAVADLRDAAGDIRQYEQLYRDLWQQALGAWQPPTFAQPPAPPAPFATDAQRQARQFNFPGCWERMQRLPRRK